MGLQEPTRLLIVDQAVTFGGSLVVMANIANNLHSDFQCSVIYEVPDTVGNYLFEDRIKKHRIHNILNYRTVEKLSEKINLVKIKYIKLFFLKLLALGKHLVRILQVIKILKIIITDKIDIIHSNNSHEAIIAAKILHRPVVLHLHGLSANHVKDPIRNDVNTYVAISRCVANQAAEKSYDIDKTVTLPNPIVINKVNLAQKKYYMDKFLINDSDKVIGMVGRIIDWKGQLEFLDAVQIVSSKMKNVRILIIGDGSDTNDKYMKQVESKISKLGLQDKVLITGYIEDVNNIMASLDLLVHCSTSVEPFGLVITEAMSLGIPVIVSNLGAPAEIVKNKETGYIVDPHDAEKMSNYIITLLNNEKLAKTIGQKAKQDVLSNYCITNYIDNLTKEYKKLLL